MKKVVLVMLCMIFVVCQAYAQNIEVEPDTLVTAQQTQEAVVPVATEVPTVSSLITELTTETLNGSITVPDPGTIVKPIMGKSKFARSHYIYQTVDISTIAGSDKDSHAASSGNDAADGAAAGLLSGLNLGLNIGYSLIFVPGKINGDNLEFNRFGFAYSTGLVASFDRQDDSEVTCDFLFKLGIESGNGHALGIGIDGLIGGGKTLGALYDFSDDNPEPEDYTAWCFKYGAQLWIKTNLLSTSIKNTDVLIFARYVHSVDPNRNVDFQSQNVYNYWMEESWQFGITLRYNF